MKRAAVLWISSVAMAAQPILLAACSEDTTTENNNTGDGNGDGAADGSADGSGDGQADGSADGDGAGATQLGDDVAGDACSSAQDCAGTNSACLDEVGGIMGLGGTAAPGGYCSGSCTEDAQCGAGGVCAGAFAAAGLDGSCMKACTGTSDCRDGYDCVEGLSLPDGGVEGLPAELPPQPSTCQPKPQTVQLDDNVAGDACSGNDSCGGGTCNSMIGGAFGFGGTPTPGGYCTGACTEDAHCGAGGTCIVLIPFGNMAGSCYATCESCTREGYACGPIVRAGTIPGGGGGFQIPEACVPAVAEPDAGTPEPDAGAPELDGGV